MGIRSKGMKNNTVAKYLYNIYANMLYLKRLKFTMRLT